MNNDSKILSNFSNIGKVSKLVGVPQTVLRFWETQFSMITLHKINGRRYYDEKAINIIQNIKILLYEKGYTIKGAQNYLDSKTLNGENNNYLSKKVENANKQMLTAILLNLKNIKSNLEQTVNRCHNKVTEIE